MDIIYLVYGLSFLTLGLVVVIWPKHDSRFELSSLSVWLAAFAFVHGALEWMDLWRVVRGDNPALAALRPFVLLVSFLPLYEFGRRLLAAALPSPPGYVRVLLSARAHVILLAGVAAGSLSADGFLLNLAIWSRYLYGFSASLLTGIGFLLYCANRVQPNLVASEFRPVWRACLLASIAFIGYAILAGLVVPRADWGLAAWLNQESFQEISGIPVQLFRAFCSITVAFSATYVLRIFHLERSQYLRLARDRAEAALEQAGRLGRHNRLLLESVAEGIFGIDHQGRTTFINPAALTMLGYTAEELIGEPMHTLTHHSHPDGLHYPHDECPTHLTLNDGNTRHVDSDHFWRKDGSHFPVEYRTAQVREHGEIIGAVVVFQDSTERLRIEAELERYRHHLEDSVAQRTAQLQEAEQRSRLILDTSANGLYGIDTGGNLMFINPAGSSMLGYAADDLIGRPVHVTLHHTHADGSPFPGSTCPMLGALRHGKPARNDDDLFWRADGTPLPVATATQPMLKEGHIVGAVVSFIDISQRKALDAARDQALAEAERLTRVKSEFLANMSHEIRTPLNGVLGLAQIGCRDSAGRDRASETFAKIVQSGKLLLGIINDILDFSKIEAGKLEIESLPVELLGVLREVTNLMNERAQAKGLAFRIRKAPDLPSVCKTDPVRLGQILINLLANAIKFTESGSVTLGIARDGEQLVFTVTDTGIGMTPEQVARLFRPFEQADGSTTRRFGGTGLGLAITQRLLQLMDGNIRVDSQPGVGSCFEVRLPYIEANLDANPVASAGTAGAAHESGLPLAGLNILVAEDNEVNQEVIRELLSGDGADVTLADNGRQAVEYVLSLGGAAFDLVLMDIQMPEMGGHEATRRILELAPDLPIIGQTAHAFAEEKAACLAAGMVAHIAKPLDPDALVELILRYARRR
ncbi:MAG: PAS domain S-box protein [Gammaproteobacteria bacterium]|nr:PAS domain S-box protein [Gammaproteobacteria bacterium]